MSKFHIYYVYILKCSDNTYYTGVTNNLDRRIEEHKNGDDKRSYVYSRRPIKLMFYAEFSNIEVAIEKEKQIKKWSQRKKEALINSEFELLVDYSKKSFRK